MVFKQYKDVKAFYLDTFDILMRHEAQNMVPLGNVIIGNEGKDKTGWRNPANWFMATVSDDSGILLTAIMTPPHNMTLYATENRYNDRILAYFIEELLITDTSVNGVMTESNLAKDFARTYTSQKGMAFVINKEQCIYELLEVNANIQYIGSIRLAQDSDMAFLPYWIEGFNNDCFDLPSTTQSDATQYTYHLSTGNLYILEENDTAVSMAKIGREMQTACSIGQVYTPPYFRGRGYATSCVAQLSNTALARGFVKCALYTDLANPTSNSIYQKIGYKPICDSLEIKFVDRCTTKS